MERKDILYFFNGFLLIKKEQEKQKQNKNQKKKKSMDDKLASKTDVMSLSGVM